MKIIFEIYSLEETKFIHYYYTWCVLYAQVNLIVVVDFVGEFFVVVVCLFVILSSILSCAAEGGGGK